MNNNNIRVDEDIPEMFVLVEEKLDLLYLSNEGLEDPEAMVVLIYQENGITTIELDDGQKHIGVLGEWPIVLPGGGKQITHKFTCMDNLSSAFGKAITRNSTIRAMKTL